MRRMHPLDHAAPPCLAALTLGLLVALAPTRARSRPLAALAARPTPAATAAWTPGPRAPRPPLGAARAATRRPVGDAPASSEAPGVVDGRGPRAFGGEAAEVELGDGVREFYFDDMFYEHHGRYGGYRRYGRRWVGRRAPRSQQPVMSWVGASQDGRQVSLCELLPALCGAGGAARAGGGRSPESQETPGRITLSNEHLSLDMDRLGRCAVRLRRAGDRADTLLTFDLPDELVPCEARVVPDLAHDDGAAVRIDAQTPRWSQSVTVSLGAGEASPAVSIARARREGAATTHALVNASPERVVFTLGGRDFSAGPGEALTLSGG